MNKKHWIIFTVSTIAVLLFGSVPFLPFGLIIAFSWALFIIGTVSG